jgi:uncharacterized protein YbbC (DUF1343 family)
MPYSLVCLLGLLFCQCTPQPTPLSNQPEETSVALEIQPGAWHLDEYLPMLKNKRVGLVVNHSSTVRSVHLLDTLRKSGITIPKVFTPEHGFTGMADAGEHVADEKKAGSELISLFGEKRKPDLKDLEGLDVVVFDMQDVGVRFYTYISTMHYMMEACSQLKIPFVVLDRPNPNGSYVDGPFLKTTQYSFVGLHPIPIVHGLTVGELALMINGEGWLGDGLRVELTVIKIKNWTHQMPYSLPIKPSPNLPNDRSIALYPSLCLFEGTMVSVGRGTDIPFQHVGHPDYPDKTYSFVPTSREGAKAPLYEGQDCYGIDFTQTEINYAFTVQPVIDFYQKMGKPKNFFNSYIKLLAGDLDEQIKAGMTEQEIRQTWKDSLDEYKNKREKYLLYPN